MITGNKVTIDSGKLLSLINNSAQSKIKLYENVINKLGDKLGKNWKLLSLNGNKLFIEDVDTGDILQANHVKIKGGKINISNVLPVEIVENKKAAIFEQSCNQLVEAIEANNSKNMRSAYNTLAAHRFSPRVIPTDRLVKTKDGVVHKINLLEDKNDNSAFKTSLVKALVESVTDNIVMEEGRIVDATICEKNNRIPVSEWTCRKQVANYMREHALNAYEHSGFQNRVHELAKLIQSYKIEEAVNKISKFLKENQEFTMLTHDETLKLVENTLATKAIMNQRLCEDVALLIHNTNLKINREDIINEWKKVAVKSQHAALIENVSKLEYSKDFNKTYDKFLTAIFESMSPREEEFKAYQNALNLLRDTPQVKRDKELSGKLDDLVGKFKNRDVDTATMSLVREALSAAKKEVDHLENLDNYDELDDDISDEVSDAMSEPIVANAENGVPNIVINAPLIQVGGNDTNKASEVVDDEMNDLAGPEGELDYDDLGAEGDIDLENDLEDDGLSDTLDEIPSDEANPDELAGETESGEDDLADLLNNDEESDEDELELESKQHDPYNYDFNDDSIGMGVNYGIPILESEIPVLVRQFNNYVEAQRLTDDKLAEDVETVAKAVIDRSGIKIPEDRMLEAIDLVISAFCEKQLAEDQYKWGKLLAKRGYNRNKVNPVKSGGSTGVVKSDGLALTKKSANEPPSGAKDSLPSNADLGISESVIWEEHDVVNNGIAGNFGGVNFTMDYANPPVILDVTGTIEVPIPDELVESALACAKLQAGDSKPFMTWLASNINQLSPMTEDDKKELDEAVAIVTASGDGTVEVRIDGDVDVSDVDETDMVPVDDNVVADVDVDVEVDDMPDFENPEDSGEVADVDFDFGSDEESDDEVEDATDLEGSEESEEESESEEDSDTDDEVEDQEEDEEEEEEEDIVEEDHDVTDPSKSDYDTTDDDHRADPKDGGKAQKPNNNKKLDGFEKREDSKVGKSDVELKSVKPGTNVIE